MTVDALRRWLGDLPGHLPVQFDSGLDDDPCVPIEHVGVNLHPDKEGAVPGVFLT